MRNATTVHRHAVRRWCAATALTVLASLGCAPVVAARPASADGCQALTELDAQTLETFEFESGGTPWEDVPDRTEYRLGTVTVVRQDVFELEENWLHRAANRYHMRTRERVIRSVLPLRSGAPVDGRLLAEAERILRNKVYLYDARVIPQRLCGDVLDVFVVTRDVWTLMPRVSVVRAGGENDLGFGISDTNIFGSGKSLLVGYEKDQDRRGISFAYSDPNVLDSRWAFDLGVVDSDDGERYTASLRHPFYALNTRHALLLGADDWVRDEGLYFLGDEVWEYGADTRLLQVAGGLSTGLRDGFVNRLLLGYGQEDYRFDLPAEFLAEFPNTEAPDRRFGYPYLAFERIEDDFDKRVNLDRVQRTEDVALGRRIYLQLGYSTDAFGGEGRHLVGRGVLSDAVWLTPRQLLTGRAWIDGYYDLDEDAGENVTAQAQLDYRYQHAERWSLLVRGSLAAARNQTLDQQLLLGGEFGLRGYPNRYQLGDRRFLITVEERYYSNVYPLRMFRLGTAAFLDVGRAWYEGPAPDWLPGGRDEDYFGVLSDVGVGLRLESTRTRGDLIIHLDFAVPLVDGPDVRGVEVTLTAKQTL